MRGPRLIAALAACSAAPARRRRRLLRPFVTARAAVMSFGRPRVGRRGSIGEQRLERRLPLGRGRRRGNARARRRQRRDGVGFGRDARHGGTSLDAINRPLACNPRASRKTPLCQNVSDPGGPPCAAALAAHRQILPPGQRLRARSSNAKPPPGRCIARAGPIPIVMSPFGAKRDAGAAAASPLACDPSG
jgi:hypothetical protein